MTEAAASPRRLRLATIPPDVPFLDVLAARWLAEHGGDALGRGLILLPTRRAARALAEAFLRASGGRALVLPRITAFGALDEAPLTMTGALDLLPAIDPQERLAALAALVMKLPPEQGGAGSVDRALMLARELARLMDEAERAEIDLASALQQAADAAHAEHWQATLRFLEIVTRHWPDWLAAQGVLNPAARQVALLQAQAAEWAAHPPAEPVWAAGTTAGIPAVAALLRVVAGLPDGQVVLPGLDLDLPQEAWEAIGEAHPQCGLQRLLAGLGATRGDVVSWDGAAAAPAGRVRTLARALLPAAALPTWREAGPVATTGLFRLEAADEQEEAAAIALILRDTLERRGARAALVTPDRQLAGRVSSELLRWGVVADDSAGEALAESPPAVFLRLLAETVTSRFAPVPLLGLLKHPLAAAGLEPVACRMAARLLEVEALRGPRPAAGLGGLRQRAQAAPEPARDLLARLETCLDPLLRAATAAALPPATLLAALIEAGEALATSEALPGPARLWAHEEGEALAVLLAGAQPALAHLPDAPPTVLPGLLDALLEGAVVRSRRALRGREGAEHPRVFIWGLLEARLQTAEVVVLGGLVEGVWPPATDPGPWMSRPMRIKAGLPGTEEVVGLAAHDFLMAACSAPTVVLSCPRRRDRAPAVPARWLARLEAFLAGQGQRLPSHPAAGWARLLDQPAGPPAPVRPPAPCPPVRLRPRRLSVTEIETWLTDPYAIHAKHILKLRPLKPLEEATDAADYGALVHRGMQIFLDEVGADWPADAPQRLAAAMDRALAEAGLRPALQEWWRPRLARIAVWLAPHERERRVAGPQLIRGEVKGEWTLAVPGGFTLVGRADRIERRADGRLTIIDYKTGAPPSDKDVEAGFRPQLPLEAAMAEAGAFGPELTGTAAELVYWHLSGGFVPAEERSILRGDATRIAAAVATAREKLMTLVTAFDDPKRPYLSQPHPGRVPRFSDYAQLARVAEWDLSGGGE
ncbi:Double-strand break repair protein AddB [Rhodovastum atsumiense]|uniref:Double-strand break repair protein AddB n=1 Tax=Rhodovastum atsumiense TaxID=504468 RepID=A0A5M6IRH7_9PROT|nr:double-strand break repair protein AddB [Rhodovastum atsumiense]KAA5610910.1 double-strand break repair protein AddB [Rhodovastum atsumiense]CAH2601523.1 Double-strand break repair protein AddB [Rhodovastum atsumiense]